MASYVFLSTLLAINPSVQLLHGITPQGKENQPQPQRRASFMDSDDEL